MPLAGLASVIIICQDEGPYLEQTVRFMFTVPAGYPVEVIVVDDGSRDRGTAFLRRKEWRGRPVKLLNAFGLGPARARNLGAKHARGEVLVFCDAHIVVPPGWLGKLVEALESTKAGAICPAMVHTACLQAPIYGGTLNEKFSWVGLTRAPSSLSPVALAPAGCLAVVRDVFWSVDGFEEEMACWGYDDVEFSLKLWLFGYAVAVVPDLKVIHVSRPLRPYQRPGEGLVKNLLLMAALHFKPERLEKVVGLARHWPGFSGALVGMDWALVQKKRAEYFARRVRDDDWFLSTFGIPL